MQFKIVNFKRDKINMAANTILPLLFCPLEELSLFMEVSLLRDLLLVLGGLPSIISDCVNSYPTIVLKAIEIRFSMF